MLNHMHTITYKIMVTSIGIIILCSLAFNAHAFSIAQPSAHRTCNIMLMAESGDNESAMRKGQEMKMEMASLAGAKAIAKLNINERTKRAMLAEQVEDRIFEITEEIEQIVIRNDGLLEGNEKEEAVELAKQTKALQVQYDDLVQGRPSILLDIGVDEEGEDVEGFQ